MSQPPLPTRQGRRIRLAFPQETDAAELIALHRVSQGLYHGLANGFECQISVEPAVSVAFRGADFLVAVCV